MEMINLRVLIHFTRTWWLIFCLINGHACVIQFYFLCVVNLLRYNKTQFHKNLLYTQLTVDLFTFFFKDVKSHWVSSDSPKFSCVRVQTYFYQFASNRLFTFTLILTESYNRIINIEFSPSTSHCVCHFRDKSHNFDHDTHKHSPITSTTCQFEDDDVIECPMNGLRNFVVCKIIDILWHSSVIVSRLCWCLNDDEHCKLFKNVLSIHSSISRVFFREFDFGVLTRLMRAYIVVLHADY